MMEEEGLDVEDIIKGLRKITSREVSAVLRLPAESGTKTGFGGQCGDQPRGAAFEDDQPPPETRPTTGGRKK